MNTVQGRIDARNLSGAAIMDQLNQASIRYVTALPDIVTSEGLLWPLSRDNRFHLIRICKEDEGISICAAMSYNGTRAMLLMQQTGLMDSLNSVRAICIDYQLPVVMMVGLQGKQPDEIPEQSASHGVRIIRPVLDAMGISHSLLEEPEDAYAIAGQIDSCYDRSFPHVFLIGREPA